MGINALLAGLLCITLPETKLQPTLETVDKEPPEEELSQMVGTANAWPSYSQLPKEIFEIAFLFVIGKKILPCERTTKFCCQYSSNETLLVCFGEVNFRCGYSQVLPGLESRPLIYFITVCSTAFSLGTTVMQPLYQLFTLSLWLLLYQQIPGPLYFK